MDFDLTPEEKAYQEELCEFLKREVNEGVTAETESLQGLGPYGRELLRKLGERRLLAPSWPEKYGGRGLTYVAQAITGDEMSYHRGPWPLDGLVIGPTLSRFGTDSQKDKYLTGIARGEIEFAKSPGITIRPMKTSAGVRTNEVFYEDVRVPKENLVGEKNQGWGITMSALGSERVMWSGDVKQRFDKLMEYLLEEKRSDDIFWAENPSLLDELAELDIKLHIGRLLAYKAASMGDRGLVPTYEASLSKVYITEARQHLFNVAMKMLGLYGQLSEGSKWAPLNGMVPREYLDSCRWNIVGGTSEIQRLIIALRGLELPRK